MANIMIVDDSPMIVQRLRTILEAMGHRVVAEAASGREAIEKYGKHAVDLVTMDIQMPGLDGIETIRIIREMDPQAAIVVVSSIEERSMVFGALKKGAKHYILKPFTEAKVGEVVNAVLGAAGRAAAQQPGPAPAPAAAAAPAATPDEAAPELPAEGAPAGDEPTKKMPETFVLKAPDMAALPFELIYSDDRMVLMIQRHVNRHHLRVFHSCLQGLLYFRKLKIIVECWEPVREDDALRLLMEFVEAVRSRKGTAAVVSDDPVFYNVLQSRLKTGVYRTVKEIPW